ncbi:O-antigen ligase family protein [Sulfuritalea hydrogenivorans]|uniref:O-antigen ligase-related domain-containing protein n=1 Tax=Sulfuritalea hydrogenivorans sk43H TaxID=1223802 RepID=W0SKC3_9PROT|nr:O-antigen ligase family protein [Sulfuritalea hydrogenivorans]BAO31306.1 hypothetical protein SUTH_03536 [Sulfuritalea hydrogenivorans sk43H]
MGGYAGCSAKQWQFAAWLAAVAFIFPIPHTIALRNLLLLVGLVGLVWIGRTSLPKPASWMKPAAWCLIALTSWIAFHSVTVAPSPTLALDQFRANWMMPLLLGGVGAWAATQLPRERAAQVVVIALAAHMVWLLGWQITLWLKIGAWPFKATPFGAYDFHGTLNSYLLALLVADRLAWTRSSHSPLALGQRGGWALLALSLAADVALQSRNSTVVSVAILAAGSLVLLNAQSHRRRLAIVALGAVALIAASSFRFDHRWQSLRESIVIGWTSNNTYWLTGDGEPGHKISPPATPSGDPLETSAYLRAAMARQSIDFLADHPLGIGFGHDAFGRAIAMKHGHSGMISSHSGWLDFALGTGFVGLALLLTTAGVAIRAGWRQFRERQDAQALLLAFFVGGYMLRCLLDGHLSGWRLGLFSFVVGVLVAGMHEKPDEP